MPCNHRHLAAGFDTPANMARFFRFFQRETGILPRAFRQRRQGPQEAGG